MVQTRAVYLVTSVSVAVIALVVILAALGNRTYRLEQQQLASQVARGVVSELDMLMEKLRFPMQLFAGAESKLLEAIRSDPDNTDLHERLRTRTRAWFPDYYAVSLASANGHQLYVDDFGEQIGELCRSDIREFARLPHAQQVYLHPGPGRYHFDLMAHWSNGNGSTVQGILFVSFAPEMIAQRLANSQVPGHQLLLLRTSQSGLIEITADGARDSLQRNNFLSEAELQQALYRGDVPGTDWELLVLPDSSLFATRQQRLTFAALMVISAYGIAVMFLMRRIRQEERARDQAQHELQESNRNLEQRVKKRTEELRESVSSLEHEVLERRQAERALHDSERLFRALIEDSIDIISIVDQDGVFDYVSPSVSRAMGYAPAELRGKAAALFIHPRDKRRAAARIRLALRRPAQAIWTQLRIRNKHGEWRRLEASFKSFSLDTEHPLVVINARDVTERREQDEQRQKLASAVEQTADLVMITNRAGVIEYVNPAFCAVTGYDRLDILGQRPSVLRSGTHDQRFYAQLWQTIASGNSFRGVVENRTRSGALYFEEKTITPLKDRHGRITHFISTGKDITERMQAQEQLHHLAHHDALTGLPNRALMRDRLEQALLRARREECGVALMFLDLDNFKVINDTLGHKVGDELLQEVAQRLQHCLRENDTIARLGGDEFVVILENLTASDEIVPVAQKLVDSLAGAFSIKGNELYVTTSVGITLYPDDAENLDNLISHADAAMYQAKALGGNRFEFFTPQMATQIAARLSLEGDLRRAWQNEDWQLHYQPQIQLASGQVVGAEALLRWKKDGAVLVDPGQFIASLEQTGMIIPVGEWVLAESCHALRQWRQAGLADIRVAVNLAARQLYDARLLDIIARILGENRLPYNALEFEITEGTLLEDLPGAVQVLRRLRESGATVAIDDFGTGYSSLSYLKRLPIDRVKIDQSFVAALPDQEDAAIVKTIIDLAHSLDLTVIAEGVETREQLEFLREQGCDEVQGYLIARPLAAETLEAWLVQGKGVVTPMRA